jgi:hypothetical protein
MCQAAKAVHRAGYYSAEGLARDLLFPLFFNSKNSTCLVQQLVWKIAPVGNSCPTWERFRGFGSIPQGLLKAGPQE